MGDVRWLSYREMADALAIAPKSAQRLAQRRKWQRRPGNDGQVRIGVPVDRLPAATDAIGPTDPPTVAPSSPPTADNAVHLALARLEVEVAGLRQLVEAERARAEAERRRADAAEADRDAWREQTEVTQRLLADRSAPAASTSSPWWRRLIRAA